MTVYSLFIQIASALSFYGVFGYMSTIEITSINKLSGMFFVLIGFVTQYYLLFFYIVGFILIDMGLEIIDNQIMDKVDEIDYYDGIEQ